MPDGAPERAVLGSSARWGCVSALHELQDRRAVRSFIDIERPLTSNEPISARSWR